MKKFITICLSFSLVTFGGLACKNNPLLHASAVTAARESKFSPTLLGGKPVKVTGVVVYNFVP